MIGTVRHSKSSLLLIEIIIAVLFFAVCGSICLQAFTKAHCISRETGELNMAVSVTENMAEIVQGAKNPDKALETASSLYDLQACDNGSAAYFDGSWNSCPADSKNCAYVLRCSFKKDYKGITGLTYWNFKVSSLDTKKSTGSASANRIYKLKVEVYYGP